MAMDFTFEQPIEYGTRNSSSLLISENRLINCATGWIELYAIEPDGSLTLLDRLQNDLMITPAQMYDGIVYVADTVVEQYSRIRAISINGDVLSVQNSIIITHEEIGDLVAEIRVNDDYLFYMKNSSSGISEILNRSDFEFIGTMDTGFRIHLDENILFKEMTNGVECMLQIEDISDITNPIIMSQYIIGEYQKFCTYKIYGDTLFIAKNTDINIFSISDLYNPELLGTISNLPGLQTYPMPYFCDIERHGNELILIEKYGDIWVYDISDPSHASFITHSGDIMEYSCIVQPIAVWGSSLYATGEWSPIMQFDCNSFPAFSQRGAFGNPVYFQWDALMDNWYIYTSAHQDIRYCKKDSPVLEARCKKFPGRVVKMCVTGSELYSFEFYDADNYADTLYVIEDTGEDLEISRKIDVSNLFIKEAYYIEPYFACITHTTGQLDFFQLTDTGLELVESGVGSDFICFHKQPEDLNYLYCLNDDRDIVRIQKEPPFSILGTGDLSGLGPCPIIYVTSDERGVVWGEIGAPVSTVSLVALDDEMNVIVLDQMQTQCDGAVDVVDDIVFMLSFLGHEVQFYHYQNDEFELFYEYDFERIINRLAFDPQNETVYCLGLFNAERYTYQPTAADPQLAPLPAVTLSNYPNPFNPSTEIRFQMSDASQLEHAQIEIFNVKGQKVRKLKADMSSRPQRTCAAPFRSKEGMESRDLSYSITWDGTDNNGAPVASGLYLYQLRAGKQTLAQKKMMLLK
jgi:hypothetical protein